MATQPVILSASFASKGVTLLQWNTSVNITDAAASGNYSINPSLPVTSASYNPTLFSTTINHASQSFATVYTITVVNVRDITNALTVAPSGNMYAYSQGGTLSVTGSVSGLTFIRNQVARNSIANAVPFIVSSSINVSSSGGTTTSAVQTVKFDQGFD